MAQFRDASVTGRAQGVRLAGLPSPGWGVGCPFKRLGDFARRRLWLADLAWQPGSPTGLSGVARRGRSAAWPDRRLRRAAKNPHAHPVQLSGWLPARSFLAHSPCPTAERVDFASVRTALALILGTVALALSACGGSPGISSGDDLAAGKRMFLSTPSRGEIPQPSCAGCHELEDAGSPQGIGPNLDDAFRTPRREGFGQSTFEQVVREQIEIPGVPTEAATKNPDGPQRLPMPSRDDYGLTSEEADDIAFYIATCAGLPSLRERLERCPQLAPAEGASSPFERDDRRTEQAQALAELAAGP